MKLGILLASAAAAMAQNNVLGILSLPEVFGPPGFCEPFVPSELKLYAAPKPGRSIGSIRVITPLKFLSDGGCEGAKVRVYRRGVKTPLELPVREYTYEYSGAIVVDQRDRWFRLRLADGFAWLRASEQAEYHSLDRLLEDLPYVEESAGGVFFPSPGAIAEGIPLPGGGREVRVIEFRMYGGQRWVNIEVMSHSICDADNNEKPRAIGRGWLPLYTAAGEPTLWFPSRGC